MSWRLSNVVWVAVLSVVFIAVEGRVVPRDKFGLDRHSPTGKGVRVATFDTGIASSHAHFKSLRLRRCEGFTTQATCLDGFGHGSFVAGTIAATTPDCPGIAPDVDLYTYKVFTDGQSSFTTWFLDALNSALPDDVDVANLSIGGPDYFDQPFVDKIREASASGLTIVTAIGNDGPNFGTCLNPGDQLDVVAVGGHVANKDRLAQFSARGLTTWEGPGGVGRPKPDVVTYGESLYGTSHRGGCKELSGTSVAAPVVTGVLALVAERLKAKGIRANPALLKQLIIETAVPIAHTCRPCVTDMFPRPALSLPAATYTAQFAHPSVVSSVQDIDDALEASIVAQGAGAVDAAAAIRMAELLQLESLATNVSLHPKALLLDGPCSHLWPYCDQPLFHTSQPLAVNVTILVAAAASAELLGAIDADTFTRADVEFDHPAHEALVAVALAGNRYMWPWAGAVAISFAVKSAVAERTVVTGRVLIKVRPLWGTSPYPDLALRHGGSDAVAMAELPFAVVVLSRPPKNRRVLWDTVHSIQYPPAFIPRDNLGEQQDLLDWHGDSPFSNYRHAFHVLQRAGYYVEVPLIPVHGLASVDLSLYGVILIVEPEDFYYLEELRALHRAVFDNGTSLVVFADWHDVELTTTVAFTDDNTGDYWEPVTGGANVPALNMMLHPFGVELAAVVWEGSFAMGARNTRVSYMSGNSLYRVPTGSTFCAARQLVDQSTKLRGRGAPERSDIPVVSLVDASYATTAGGAGVAGAGRVAVYGDSSCLDSIHIKARDYCFDLLLGMMSFAQQHIDENAAARLLEGPSLSCRHTAVEVVFDVRRGIPVSVEDAERWVGPITTDPLSNISCPLRNRLRLPMDGTKRAFERARRAAHNSATSLGRVAGKGRFFGNRSSGNLASRDEIDARCAVRRASPDGNLEGIARAPSSDPATTRSARQIGWVFMFAAGIFVVFLVRVARRRRHKGAPTPLGPPRAVSHV